MDKIEITLEPQDNNKLLNLCGPLNNNIKEIELRFDVEINQRGNLFNFLGNKKNIKFASEALKNLYKSIDNEELSIDSLREFLHQPNSLGSRAEEIDSLDYQELTLKNYKLKISNKLCRLYK